MHCCQCQAIETEFNPKVAERELSQYRRQGPRATTRLLVDALLEQGVAGLTLLDIGGGVGAIAHSLLRAGAAQATDVEAAAAYVAAARAEAERQGHADRLSLRHGDFVALAATLPPADIVTLDRVICCYPDMPALVELSAARARRLYGAVYPRGAWWVRLGLAVINSFYWLRRSPFRVFAHPPPAIDALVRAAGLRRSFHRTTLVWEVVVYERAVAMAQ